MPPISHSTKSFWRIEPHDMDSYRSTPDLPEHADIVIIGAGYVGASTAYHLVKTYARKKQVLPSIVILEAREACSGATGRNGGHLRPDYYVRAAGVLDTVGRDAAVEIAEFERKHLYAIENLVDSENIDCDFVSTNSHEVHLTEATRNKSKVLIEKARQNGISTANEIKWENDSAAEKVSGFKNAKGCFSYPAAHLWPYKLVLHLLQVSVKAGVKLHTHTYVQSVTIASNPPRSHHIHTARGPIQAHKVIYATNAYTSDLLPALSAQIVPVRGYCCHIVPRNPKTPRLKNTYGVRINEWAFDYLIPRGDGSIILGGARQSMWQNLDSWYNNKDDSVFDSAVRGYVNGYMQRNFAGWEDSGAEVRDAWSGIMGYSGDGFPFVGELPNQPGQYIAAGFTGHGMVNGFLSAKGLAEMIVENKDISATEIPRLYHVSKARIERTEHNTLEEWKKIPKDSSPRAQI